MWQIICYRKQIPLLGLRTMALKVSSPFPSQGLWSCYHCLCLVWPPLTLLFTRQTPNLSGLAWLKHQLTVRAPSSVLIQHLHLFIAPLTTDIKRSCVFLVKICLCVRSMKAGTYVLFTALPLTPSTVLDV